MTCAGAFNFSPFLKNNKGYKMVRDVYNNIALDDFAVKVVSYPKRVCATPQAALHGFVRDMSLSQLKILQVSIFEDPFFAYVDIEVNLSLIHI